MQTIAFLETKEIRNLGILLGAVTAGLVIIYFFALYFSGAMLFDPFYKFDFWVTIPFIIAGIIYLRKYQRSLRAWQGLVLGFYITIVCAGIISLFYYLFLTVIETNFITESLTYRIGVIEAYKVKAIDPEGIKHYEGIIEQTKLMGENTTPLDVSLDKIVYHYIVGAIVTVVTSILARK